MFIDNGIKFEQLYAAVILAVVLLISADLIFFSARIYPNLQEFSLFKKLVYMLRFCYRKIFLVNTILLVILITGLIVYYFLSGHDSSQTAHYLILGGVATLYLALIDISFYLARHVKQRQDPSLQEISKLKIQSYLLLAWNFLSLIFIGFAIVDMSAMPHVVSQYPTDNAALIDYTKPIEVIFDRPINSQTIKTTMAPKVKGEWRVEAYDPNFPQIKRVLRFYPQESAFPEQPLFLYYAGITNLTKSLEPWEYAVNATTTTLPQVVSTLPVSDNTDIAIDEPIEIFFDRYLNSSYEWQVEMEPQTESTHQTKDNKLTITPAGFLNHNTKYTIRLKSIPIRFALPGMEVIERGDSTEVYSFSFQTVREPLISSITPGNGSMINEPVKVTFDQAMDTAQVAAGFTIEPSVKGTYSWEGNTLIFTHDDFAKNTSYTIKLPKFLASLKGGMTQQAISHSFKTIGAVEVSSFSPGNGAGSASITTAININFNQAVDHASAQSHFSISPSISGNFSWSGNTMIFKPAANLTYQTKYNISVRSGIKTVYGLDSQKDFNSSFTTQEELFQLNVPVYYQTLRFSCNLEATRMTLAYRGITKSVLSLYGEIAKDTTPYDSVNNTFGDPYKGYVGDIYGKTKGYGVYWPPLSALISKYRSNTIHTGWNLSGLLSEISKGNPVIIWAHNDYSYAGNAYYWTTPEGTSIRAITGMHSYVVVGYKGPIDNPREIIINDTNRGRISVNKDHFLYLWGFFNNTGIVVY